MSRTRGMTQLPERGRGRDWCWAAGQRLKPPAGGDARRGREMCELALRQHAPAAAREGQLPRHALPRQCRQAGRVVQVRRQ